MSNNNIGSMKCILYLFGLLSIALQAQAASFDCAKAATKVEKLICGDADISKLDEELNAAYKTALKNEKQADTVKQAQKQWMKERNDCSDAACVKGAYVARLKALVLSERATGTDSAGMVNTDTNQGAEDSSQNGQQYHFQLTKGKGIPVCNAYLERLNTTKYEDPPFCDRLENDSVKGFAKLARVPVSASVLNKLYPIINAFMLSANQKNLDWADMSLQQRLVSKNKGTPSTMQDWLNRNSEWAKVWRYDPPIDIDNDGVPDNVEVWYGHVLPTGVGGRPCGADFSDKFPGLTSLRQPQEVFVITGSNDWLDAQRVVNIFGHPAGGYRFYDKAEQKWKTSGDFRPIGDSIGIFKYQDVYYFDTFFDGWGDFEDKRQKDKNISNTLAVFMHKNGKTKQVCEYLMTDNETQNERGAK